MKKKITALCLVVAMAVVAIGGATLAYFTDTDKANNTFTIGKVDIQLIEQERKEIDKETKLVDFVDGKKLFPIVGSAQGAKDEYGLPTAANYVDKIVRVKNLEEDAYVRVYIAVPAALVKDGSVEHSSQDILHWNWGNKFTAAGDYDTTADPQPTSSDYTANMGDLVKLSGTYDVDGVECVVYYQTYKKALTKNEYTGSAFMVGMYLDSKVDAIEKTVGNEKKTVYTYNGNEIDFDFSNGVTIPVYAIGAQAAGFNDADTAINAAFGDNYCPWTAHVSTNP